MSEDLPSEFSEFDVAMMQLALAQADSAAAMGEVPVGAVITKNGAVISAAHNQPIHLSDPSAHAELLALRQACSIEKNYRLVGATVYVSLEPCAMCMGALLQARVSRIVFGASDEKSGACGSALNLAENAKLNHHAQVEGGLLKEESVQALQSFFKIRRAAQKARS